EIGRLNDFLAAGNYTGKGNEYFKIGPLKLLTDGSLGGRTAYLSVPYHDAPDRQGIPVFTQEELDNLIVT
ncbi:MAG: amidohydrolase, partial [Acetivibrio sp.]